MEIPPCCPVAPDPVGRYEIPIIAGPAEILCPDVRQDKGRARSGRRPTQGQAPDTTVQLFSCPPSSWSAKADHPRFSFVAVLNDTPHHCWMEGGYVYIMTNRQNGTLYVGVTADLPRRVHEHRVGIIEGFTKRYGLKRLVYVERHNDIRDAIGREKTIKSWRRAWKVRLIHGSNPDWNDLSETLL